MASAVFDAHLCVAEHLLYGQVPYPEVIRLAEQLRRVVVAQELTVQAAVEGDPELVLATAGQALGFVLLGFTSVFREGAETVLFLQALVLDAGTWIGRASPIPSSRTSAKS